MADFHSVLVAFFFLCNLIHSVTIAEIAAFQEKDISTHAEDALETDKSSGCCSPTNRETTETSPNIDPKLCSGENDCDTIADAKSKDPEQNAAKNAFVSTHNSGRYPRTNKMVFIKGGTFIMGSDNQIIPADGEGPARKVTLDSFYLDVHETSNAEFERFIGATGYVTEVCSVIYYCPSYIIIP